MFLKALAICGLVTFVRSAFIDTSATNAQNSDIRVASFNVQIFGKAKMGKPLVPKILARIVTRYDLVLIQEIRDKSGQAIVQFMAQVKALNANYDYIIGARLGRSTSKEQYAYIYRKDRITIKDHYQYPDPMDIFAREPLCVRVQPVNKISEFAVCGCHVTPKDVVNELNEFTKVVDGVVGKWGIDNIMLYGDFNADCSYLSATKEKSLSLSSSKYKWLIGDNVDSTVKTTNCAYDRIILHGDKFQSWIVPGSAKEYRYDTALGLTADLAEDVSDHYPVEVKLRLP